MIILLIKFILYSSTNNTTLLDLQVLPISVQAVYNQMMGETQAVYIAMSITVQLNEGRDTGIVQSIRCVLDIYTCTY